MNIKILYVIGFFLIFSAQAAFAEETPTYRKKDIEFENRVVESMKRAPLDPSYDLESGKAHPDLHKKRMSYGPEIAETLQEWKP